MQVRSPWVERILKSRTFSLVLFAVWGWIAYRKGRERLSRFEFIEMAWCVYNAAISVLFLVRTRPSIVSMDPIHWLVALVTSFSGFFFQTYDREVVDAIADLAEGLIWVGLLLGLVSAVSLGRSYDFLPSLRGIQTGWAYRAVRHPMYLSSIIIRLGYLIRHVSPYNLAVFMIMLWLYVIRCRFEEAVMTRDPRYLAYMERVRCRLLPMLY